MTPWKTVRVDVKNELCLAGPVSSRVAVIDLDETSGMQASSVPFTPPKRGGKRGAYRAGSNPDLESRQFNQLSVFGTIRKTLDLFEKPDVLGREISWAFGGPQLLVVPRAGIMKNAFYDRDARSLLFFSFPSPKTGRMVHTSMSQDIVAHETAHAAIDGIIPELYDAISPQSLALHEAVADLSAMLLAYQTRELTSSVLANKSWRIEQDNPFSWIAEEYGAEGEEAQRADALRNLNNKASLDPADKANYVGDLEYHKLSLVMSGALASVLRLTYLGLLRERRKTEETASGQDKSIALNQSSKIIWRMMIRGIDYLPPGEASFRDYVRAIIAADQASHPESGDQRKWLETEALARGIATSRGQLAIPPPRTMKALEKANLDTLVASEWEAYRFVDLNRATFHVPKGASFVVKPRLDVTKEYRHRAGREKVRELIMKVHWELHEKNPKERSLPPRRRVTMGTTMAVDWKSKRVRAILTSDPSAGARTQRDKNLVRMLRLGIFDVQSESSRAAPGLSRAPLVASVRYGVLNLRGLGRAMHLGVDEL